MPATWHQTGAVDHYVRLRGTDYGGGPPWEYLGTSVLCPVPDATVYTTPWTADYVAPVPVNEIYHGETHEVLTTLNRFNYVTYNKVRARGASGAGVLGLFAGVQRRDPMSSLGKLIRNVEDFALLLKFNPPSPTDVSRNNTPTGRMYYSARLTNYRETTENSRLIESSLLLFCVPLFDVKAKRFDLFTESEIDWGSVPDPE